MKKLEYAQVLLLFTGNIWICMNHVRNITGLRMQIWSVCWHLVIETDLPLAIMI